MSAVENVGRRFAAAGSVARRRTRRKGTWPLRPRGLPTSRPYAIEPTAEDVTCLQPDCANSSGDIVPLAARERGVAAIVIDGAIRDRAQLEALDLPVFHVGTWPRGPGNAGPGALRVPVTVGGATIQPVGLVCANADRIAVVAAADAAAVLESARGLEERERAIVAAIERGDGTVAIFHLKERE